MPYIIRDGLNCLISKLSESDLKNMAREAELQKLQLQLQPHFLFNSLNSINALILIKPDEATKDDARSLSDFLRLTIKRADEPWISLSQELEYLKTYLAIEKVRFGHRLDVIITIDEPCYESGKYQPWCYSHF
jgi:two-component system LytT family sensor kinase